MAKSKVDQDGIATAAHGLQRRDLDALIDAGVADDHRRIEKLVGVLFELSPQSHASHFRPVLHHPRQLTGEVEASLAQVALEWLDGFKLCRFVGWTRRGRFP